MHRQEGGLSLLLCGVAIMYFDCLGSLAVVAEVSFGIMDELKVEAFEVSL